MISPDLWHDEENMKPASLSVLALDRPDVSFGRMGQTVSYDTLSTGNRVDIYILEYQDLLQLTNCGGHKLRRLLKRSAHRFAHSTDSQSAAAGQKPRTTTTIDRAQFEFKARCSLDKCCTRGG
jgi:hypothetical protein